MASEWKTRAQEIISDPRNLKELPGVLASARSLNPLPHNVADSLLYDWMRSAQRTKTTKDHERRLDVLRILLDAGIDPHQGQLDRQTSSVRSRELELYRKHVDLITGRASSDAAHRLGLGVPFKGSVNAFETNWMAKVIWAARKSPALVGMVQLFLERGVHPHDQGARRFLKGECEAFHAPEDPQGMTELVYKIRKHPWSSWPAALSTGRQDVLELLASHAGPERPVDWVPAVSAACMAINLHPSQAEPIAKALAWFLDRYPPTLAERAAVMSTMVRDGRIRTPSSLAVWLTLPQSTLRDANGPLEAPEGFNPWACIGEESSKHIDRFMENLGQVLLAHPRWGNAHSLLAAPWERFGSVARDPEMKGPSILASWIQDSRLTGMDQHALTPAVETLFQGLDALEGIQDPALPRLFLWMNSPPGPEASAWLRRNPEAWLKEQTPWHHGPQPVIQDWLQEMGISAWAPDVRGVPGVGAGLVERLKDWCVASAEEFISHARALLTDPRMDWEKTVEGFSLAQWAHGSDLASGLSPMKGWDAGAFSVATLLGDKKRFGFLLGQWERQGSPELSMTEKEQLLAAWARGTSRYSIPPDNASWKEDEVRLRQEMLAHILRVAGSDVIAQLAPKGRSWMWERMQGLDAVPGPRTDMEALWEAYDSSGARLVPRDRWALAWWALDNVDHQLGSMANSCPGLSSFPAWDRLPEGDRAWVAQATLVLARKKSDGMDCYWLNRFVSEFSDLEDITLGAHPRRVCKLLDFLDNDVPRMYAKESVSPPPLLGKWLTVARARQMDKELPTPDSPRPRLGARGRL